MGGGITPCVELETNIKCVVYSILIGIIYWYTPKKNINVTIIVCLLHIFANIGYDKYYRCKEHNNKYIRYITLSIIFGLFVHFVPRKNWYILAVTIYFPYMIMAYYDFFFNCDHKKLQPSPFPFGRMIYVPFKPGDYKNKVDNLCPNGTKVWDFVDRVTLFIIIGVIFVVSFGKIIG